MVSCGVSGFNNQQLTGSSSSTGPRCTVIGLINDGPISEFRRFNINAFQAPVVGSQGLEAQRDQLLVNSSPINNWDLSLSKKFFIWEKLNIETRIDAFNAFNSAQGGFLNFFGANYTAPGSTTLVNNNAANATTNRTGYGAVSGYRPNRTMQLMLRVSF